MKWGIVLSALLGTCGVAEHGQDAPVPDALPFDDRGLTGPWVVQREPEEEVALRVVAPEGTCAQLVSAKLLPWPPPEPGQEDSPESRPVELASGVPFAGDACSSCLWKSSPFFEDGLFVLPPEVPPHRPLALQFGRVRCDTRTPTTEGGGETLAIVATAHPTPGDERLSLPLRVWFERDEVSAREVMEIIDEAEAFLQAANLDLAVTALQARPPVADALTVRVHEPIALFGEEKAGVVDVVFARCVRVAGDFLAGPRPVAGVVRRIPGGTGSREPVLLSGPACPTVSRPLLGKTLAHELGHFLGLHHTDDMTRSDAATLMNSLVEAGDAVGLTEAQVRLARTHPYLRSEGARL